VAARSDLNYLFQEMLGNMSVGHHNAGGGDTPQPQRYSGGLLGADYSIENGRYRFKRIYNGENWNPNLVAPLTQPGVDVREGEYLLAVNGRDVRSTDNIYSFFQETAGKQIVIKVGANPDGSGSRQVTVVPVGNEGGLRNLAWIEDNRRKVDELSGGQLAYVYLPNTGGPGYTSFNRYYFAQIDRQGAVIDERFNGGGAAADYMIGYMTKPLMNYWSTREGEDFTTPVGAIYGPKAMIINEYSSSGGDLLPWLFRENKVGTLVGKRTGAGSWVFTATRRWSTAARSLHRASRFEIFRVSSTSRIKAYRRMSMSISIRKSGEAVATRSFKKPSRLRWRN
jgi:tricorn protease